MGLCFTAMHHQLFLARDLVKRRTQVGVTKHWHTSSQVHHAGSLPGSLCCCSPKEGPHAGLL